MIIILEEDAEDGPVEQLKKSVIATLQQGKSNNKKICTAYIEKFLFGQV